jgi:RNA polymerase-binding transcription factor DksA
MVLPCDMSDPRDMSDVPSSQPDETWAASHLEAERASILESLAGLRRGFQQVVDASADSNADDEHDPEGSTIAFERAQLKALIQQGERHLKEIEDAQARVAVGRYGLCERCRAPIAADRLRARPAARTCITCAGLASY